MSDITVRLRGWKHAAMRRDGSTLATMTEAADEIDRLRELLRWVGDEMAARHPDITARLDAALQAQAQASRGTGEEA